jgi:tetratricopeptide (TPR) repeat protein
MKKKPTNPTIPHWSLAAVLIFTFLLYARSLFNDFVYLDDDQYILTNPFIRDFSFHGIKVIFSSFYFSNYHPLTTLTFLFEYKLYGLNAFPYHLFNVVLHVINTWLVFQLAGKLSGKKLTALVVALLFAVHPMHVESVAWISERKDVLYACFFLLSLLFYLRYLESGYKTKFYLGALFLFVISLLSKSAAVTLPVVLVAIDFYQARKINRRALLEKLPFFALALLFGIITLLSQKSGGAIGDFSTVYSPINRFFLVVYSIAFYIVKMIIPFNLSALHYYPDAEGGMLPWPYYLSLPVLLALSSLLLKKTSFRRETISGMLFFLITISVMLQFFTFGYSLTAERYTYISSIGLFYIAGQYMSGISKKQTMTIAVSVLTIFLLVFSIQTMNRIGVWKNGDVLINDVIKKNPNSFNGYWTRANLKNNKGDLQGALMDFDKVIEYKPNFVTGLRMRGDIRNKLGNFAGALEDLNLAISLNSTNAEAYIMRGNSYYKLGNIEAAFLDCNKAIELNPNLVEAYNNRCMLKAITGDTAGAMNDINKAIELAPDNAESFSSRGNLKVMMKNFSGALEDFNFSLKLNPVNSVVYINRGLARLNLNDLAGACEDWKKSVEQGNNSALQMISQYCYK